VVSTATKNLQSQLLSSDIPHAAKTLGEKAKSFKVAILKGRGNYLCLRAVSEFFSSGYWTMSQADQEEMPRFIKWLTTTKTGDLDDLDWADRSVFSRAGEECSGRHCPYYSKCFIYRARRNAAAAHLIVANHSLVLAEASSGAGNILPAYRWLIMDEAHNLESIATEQFSREVSVRALRRVLSRLDRHITRGRGNSKSGVLPSIERFFCKGAFKAFSDGGKMTLLVANVRKAASAAEKEIIKLCSGARKLLTSENGRHQLVRYKKENERRYCSIKGVFGECESSSWKESDFMLLSARFESAVARLITAIHGLIDVLKEFEDADESNPQSGDFSSQLEAVSLSITSFANDVFFVVSGENPSHAYWVEDITMASKTTQTRLVAAPLSVAEKLESMLYKSKDSVVLCSATLRVGNDFKYMARRLGCLGEKSDCEEPARFGFQTASSPFDYFRQSAVYAPDYLPDPSVEKDKYAQALSGLIGDAVEAARGRTLVLFTSYEMMNAVALSLRDKFADEGIDLIVQGDGVSRESMTEALKRNSSSTVLFGAQSFWEGVDVAGDALSCVILARLPFMQVGDPVVEARSEKVQREGGSSFRDYLLPEAAIKFRQGFGRLVRTKKDRCVVVIADSRIVCKNYGAVFRRSIPASVHTVCDPQELKDRISDFFSM
jgi:ATP-dependent DNA helicase DinG